MKLTLQQWLEKVTGTIRATQKPVATPAEDRQLSMTPHGPAISQIPGNAQFGVQLSPFCQKLVIYDRLNKTYLPAVTDLVNARSSTQYPDLPRDESRNIAGILVQDLEYLNGVLSQEGAAAEGLRAKRVEESSKWISQIFDSITNPAQKKETANWLLTHANQNISQELRSKLHKVQNPDAGQALDKNVTDIKYRLERVMGFAFGSYEVDIKKDPGKQCSDLLDQFLVIIGEQPLEADRIMSANPIRFPKDFLDKRRALQQALSNSNLDSKIKQNLMALLLWEAKARESAC